MEHVSPDDVDTIEMDNGAEYQGFSDPLGATDVAINRYRLPADEGLPHGLHAHLDQEEVFVVRSGEVVFETLSEEGPGSVTVGEGEVVRFGPGDVQRLARAVDGDADVLALGAPRDSEDLRVPQRCPDCGHDSMRPQLTDETVLLVCPECDHEFDGACPECGNEEMRLVAGDDGPVRRCPECGCTRSAR